MSELRLVETLDLSALDALAGLPPEALEALPLAIYMTDGGGRIVAFNRRAAEIWGREPRLHDPKELYCGSYRAYDTAGRPLPLSAAPMAVALSTGKSQRDQEVIIERPDGARRTVLVNIEPVRGADGRVEGAVNCLVDITARREIEEALRQSQDDLADFFDNAAMALHIVDASGIILRANQAELDLLGYRRDQYVGHHIAEFHADEEVIGEILARLSCGQPLDSHPARLRARDGSIRHVLVTSNARFRGGKFTHTRCFTVDVTEQHLAAEARREAETRLAATYSGAPVGITETDREGRLVRVNEAFVELTGYSRDELVGMTFLELTVEEDRARSAELYKQQVSGEIDRYVVEKRYRRKDGRIIDVEVSCSAVRGDDGAFRYGVRVLSDITDRKRAESDLAENERRNRELLEALPMAVYTTDAEGRITFYNRAAVEFSGREPTLGDDSWCVSWKLYWPDGSPLPHDQCPMALAIRDRRSSLGEYEAVAERPDGTRTPFMPFATPFFDADGALVGAVNMLVDISERKRAEERQKLLIDELNHRVKNTLATVQSIAVQTARDSADLPGFRKAFEGRLVALSRAHDVLTREGWDGADLKDVVAGALGALADGRLELDGPPVRLSPRAALSLSLVLHEMGTNATKYGALSCAGGRVSLDWTVKANGKGPELELNWIEEGGPKVTQPLREGFGARLIRRSVERDLEGLADLAFREEGLACRIAVPLL